MQQYNEFNKDAIQKMNTIFMNSKNSKTSHFHRLILKLPGKINLMRTDKYIALSNHRIHYSWKDFKSHKSKFEISVPT